jgi:hypothetical protein
MIDLAGLIATAALLLTLIALEVRHARADTGQPIHTGQSTHTGQSERHRLLSPAVSRGILALLWAMYLLLFLPRLLGLLT